MERFWCTVVISGIPLRCYVADVLLLDGEPVDGYCDMDEGRAVVEWKGSKAKTKQALWHEILHGCLNASGELRQIILGPRTVEARFKREELIVSFLELGTFGATVNGRPAINLPDPPVIRGHHDSTRRLPRRDGAVHRAGRAHPLPVVHTARGAGPRARRLPRQRRPGRARRVAR